MRYINNTLREQRKKSRDYSPDVEGILGAMAFHLGLDAWLEAKQGWEGREHPQM